MTIELDDQCPECDGAGATGEWSYDYSGEPAKIDYRRCPSCSGWGYIKVDYSIEKS